MSSRLLDRYCFIPLVLKMFAPPWENGWKIQVSRNSPWGIHRHHNIYFLRTTQPKMGIEQIMYTAKVFWCIVWTRRFCSVSRSVSSPIIKSIHSTLGYTKILRHMYLYGTVQWLLNWTAEPDKEHKTISLHFAYIFVCFIDHPAVWWYGGGCLARTKPIIFDICLAAMVNRRRKPRRRVTSDVKRRYFFCFIVVAPGWLWNDREFL